MPASPTSPTRMATRGLCKNAVSTPAINPAVVVPRKAYDCLRPVARVAHFFIEPGGGLRDLHEPSAVEKDHRDPIALEASGVFPGAERRRERLGAFPEASTISPETRSKSEDSRGLERRREQPPND